MVFLLFGFDKHRAKIGGRRISEKLLLSVSLLMGGAGAFVGMQVFRHKTKNRKFIVLVPIFLIINVATVMCEHLF